MPETIPLGQRKRGAPRKYGKDRISLAKRAGHARGWQVGDFELYGETVRKTHKTFLATYEPVGSVTTRARCYFRLPSQCVGEAANTQRCTVSRKSTVWPLISESK